MLLCTMLFSGCTINGRQVYLSTGCGRGNIFRIGDKKCSEEEARVYLANYYNLYGNVGSISLWNSGMNTDRLETSVKDAVLDHLSMIYAMDQYAETSDISLTDEEEQKAEDAAQKYSESLTDDDKDYLKVSVKDLTGMYEHYILAEKVYEDLMTQVDDEVSEDEARIMDAYVIYLSAGETDKADKVDEAIDAGEDFADITQNYSEDDTDEVSFGRGKYPQEVEDTAFGLENGEISDRITTDTGIYYVKCVEKYDEKLSEANKENVIASRQQTLINTIIQDQSKNYLTYLDDNTWYNMEDTPASGVTTDQFFSTVSGL